MAHDWVRFEIIINDRSQGPQYAFVAFFVVQLCTVWRWRSFSSLQSNYVVGDLTAGVNYLPEVFLRFMLPARNLVLLFRGQFTGDNFVAFGVPIGSTSLA